MDRCGALDWASDKMGRMVAVVDNACLVGEAQGPGPLRKAGE